MNISKITWLDNDESIDWSEGDKLDCWTTYHRTSQKKRLEI